ncbi:host specificity protein J [Haemophilus parainfluenzae]|uniref:host specificity protein J n=1 Tax=Haemophilus parainfluenzae TaxID=729 RepID=UPI0024DF6CC0|nr:phage tail protein [Haemophilus parainfluenzae]WIF10073.1 phage tail protein [Haemophilus parainfluenzae]
MGGKSQGSARTPHEAPDSLRSSQRLRAIGLISLGPIKGPANKWKSTYFDNTPIQNANGVDDNDESSFNFKNTEIAYTLGTQDQMPLQGFEMSEREVSVGAEIKNVTPVTRTVIDPDVTRLRITCGVSALFSQNENGDTEGTSVSLEILINGQSRTVKNINGKSSSRFYRSYIIDNLPPKPFTITVKRLTADSKSQRLQNGTHWVSYTEIIDTKLSYPNMALIGIKTDSRYNPNFPNVNLLLYGRLVKVPSTYNPETRTYEPGIWRGDWKEEWTDNPAWIFYDLVTNSLAGLGKRIGEYGLDKFQLYQIAKYCDELVDDGYGGKEPRMVSNLWITEQRDAYNVLSDMASVFRSIAVWNGTQFSAIQDRTSDPVCLYTQSNVVDGKFSRQFAAGKTIFTAVEVEYADERNFYQKAVEYVADDLMIARYGYNVKKITAYGCTSRGQAHRYGKWVLETSRLEQCTITFVVGRQGLLHLPGDIIEIADNDFAGKTLGGRVVAINGKKVTLDQPVEITADSYLSYLNDEMQLVKIKIINVDNANKSVITLETNPVGLNVMDDWVLKTPQVSTQLYRALGITENDDGSYTITALQHEPQKEAIVDGSASFVPVVTTMHNGLTKVTNADVVYSADGIRLTWSVPTIDTILTYEVRLYRNGKVFKTYLNLKNPEISFEGLPDGSYTAEIRAKNQSGQLSDPVTRSFEINLNIPRFVTKSLLFAIELDWDLPKAFTPGFSTEIWRSNTNDISTAVKVATLPYPQSNYVINGVPLSTGYYFYLRGVDKQGNKGEFTEAVFGEADHNPDNLLNALEGKITKSQLGQELINSIKADINNAVGEEAKTRQTAVAGALAQIAAQAQSAGTAIKNLEKADQAQVETIKTVTAKAESALSGITAVRQAQAQSDKANAQQISALTAKVGNAESTVSQVSNAVAGLDGKVSSMHTIKTQTIAGGRTAVAGIALGANHEESSVIVMADKFGIVANANDGNVKPVFSVANGQVGIRGDLVVAGSVTRDKLSSGSGANLFYNPIFANPTNGVPDGWTLYESGLTDSQKGERRCFQDPDYGFRKGGYLPNENIVRFHNRRTGNASTRTGISQNVAVNADSWYMVSAYMGNHNCTKVEIYIDVRGRNGEWLLHKTVGVPKNKNFVGINDAERAFIKFQVPPNGVSVDVFFFFYDADGSNLNGCWMFVGRPMLEECTKYTTQPSPWANAGLTEVHGGSIIANTIRGDHIQANQEIRAPRITGGTITGNTVNGATVNGGTVNGAVVSGGTVKGAIVEGGVIKGARLEAVTGKFSGTLEVNQLVGGNLCEVFIARVYKTISFYQSLINISAVPVKRIFFIVNSHKTFTVEANQSLKYLYTHHDENPPPEFFDISGGAPKICIAAYAISNTTTMSQ